VDTGADDAANVVVNRQLKCVQVAVRLRRARGITNVKLDRSGWRHRVRPFGVEQRLGGSGFRYRSGGVRENPREVYGGRANCWTNRSTASSGAFVSSINAMQSGAVVPLIPRFSNGASS